MVGRQDGIPCCLPHTDLFFFLSPSVLSHVHPPLFLTLDSPLPRRRNHPQSLIRSPPSPSLPLSLARSFFPEEKEVVVVTKTGDAHHQRDDPFHPHPIPQTLGEPQMCAASRAARQTEEKSESGTWNGIDPGHRWWRSRSHSLLFFCSLGVALKELGLRCRHTHRFALSLGCEWLRARVD